MTPKEMWQAYKKINPKIGDDIDAWAFGDLADELADLVLRGEKTATASAYELYKLDPADRPCEILLGRHPFLAKIPNRLPPDTP